MIHLQCIEATKDLYQEFINNFYAAVRSRQCSLKTGKKILNNNFTEDVGMTQTYGKVSVLGKQIKTLMIYYTPTRVVKAKKNDKTKECY